EEKRAKNLLIELFKEQDLKVQTDTAGNVIARREGATPLSPAVACGSHIDTVYNGGDCDCSVGVVAGLEVIRNFNEEKIKTKHPIEVIVFSGEESSSLH